MGKTDKLALKAMRKSIELVTKNACENNGISGRDAKNMIKSNLKVFDEMKKKYGNVINIQSLGMITYGNFKSALENDTAINMASAMAEADKLAETTNKISESNSSKVEIEKSVEPAVDKNIEPDKNLVLITKKMEEKKYNSKTEKIDPKLFKQYEMEKAEQLKNNSTMLKGDYNANTGVKTPQNEN